MNLNTQNEMNIKTANELTTNDVLVSRNGEPHKIIGILDCIKQVLIFIDNGTCFFVSNDQLMQVQKIDNPHPPCSICGEPNDKDDFCEKCGIEYFTLK